MTYNYATWDFNMISYLNWVNELLKDFNYKVKQSSQKKKTRVDALAQLAFLIRKTY